MNYLWKKRFLVLPLALGAMLLLSGCNAAYKGAPHMGFGGLSIDAEFGREDIVVLNRVEGTSSRTQYPFGIEVVDGDKWKVFGIPFFKDKRTSPPGSVNVMGMVQTMLDPRTIGGRATMERAYYKALEKHPDADAVFVKCWDHETAGVPLIYYNETVTVKGKAIKLKEDR